LCNLIKVIYVRECVADLILAMADVKKIHSKKSVRILITML